MVRFDFERQKADACVRRPIEGRSDTPDNFLFARMREETIRMSSGPERQSIQPNRRSFLTGLLGAGSAAVGALLAVPLVRFTLHPVLASTTEKSWSDVGSVDEFQNIDAPVKKLVTIEQRDGWRKTITEKPVYVTKDAKGELIVAGVTNKISMTVNVTPLGDRKVRITGATSVKMTDFGVEPPSPKGDAPPAAPAPSAPHGKGKGRAKLRVVK